MKIETEVKVKYYLLCKETNRGFAIGRSEFTFYGVVEEGEIQDVVDGMPDREFLIIKGEELEIDVEYSETTYVEKKVLRRKVKFED